jgi:Zn-dependent peptidase ImmA (M78 family)
MIREFRLKRRVKKLLVELDLRDSFDVPLLVRKLQQKGYNILLSPMQMTEGLESAYILRSNTYIIFYEESAISFRQQYLIFHELGHIFLGHRNLYKEELLFGGTLYSRWEEREAEIFASLLMEASLNRRVGELSEPFPQVKVAPQKKSEDETESLQKIADFFRRFDSLSSGVSSMRCVDTTPSFSNFPTKPT